MPSFMRLFKTGFPLNSGQANAGFEPEYAYMDQVCFCMAGKLAFKRVIPLL
jgi:hypothetical protein